MEIERVGPFRLQWGESLVWDDRRARLVFVDCATSTLHWLDTDDPELRTLACPSMPTGVVPTDDGRFVVALDDGLHVVDVDAAEWELLTPYPPELGGRANDACADLAGAVVTGTLNMQPGPGSVWRWSVSDGWSQLHDAVSNTNGPTVVVSVGLGAAEASLDGALLAIDGLDVTGRPEPRAAIA